MLPEKWTVLLYFNSRSRGAFHQHRPEFSNTMATEKPQHIPIQNVSAFSGSTSVLTGSSYFSTTSLGGCAGSALFKNLELTDPVRQNQGEKYRGEKQHERCGFYMRGGEKHGGSAVLAGFKSSTKTPRSIMGVRRQKKRLNFSKRRRDERSTQTQSPPLEALFRSHEKRGIAMHDWYKTAVATAFPFLNYLLGHLKLSPLVGFWGFRHLI